MILVVGSRASGKTSFVRGLGFDADSADVADNVQDAVAAWLRCQGCGGQEAARNDYDLSGLVDDLCEKAVVICAEVGNGVIPADAFGRQWRDQTGRLCVLLAQRADAVVRMVCGIPCVLKGELPR